MKIESKVVGRTIIITLAGEFLFKDIKGVKAKVNEIIAASPNSDLMLNLEKVKILDSAGVGMIVSIYRKVVFTQEKRFGLIQPSEKVENMLKSSGFTRLTKIYSSEEDALKSS